MDILNYLKEEYPDVYDRTRYVIIEISANLAELQRKKLLDSHPCVRVEHKSIFQWKTRQPAPCFFIALEVIVSCVQAIWTRLTLCQDNFAHDVIRYDIETLEPYQGVFTIDEQGDFEMYYSKVSDPLINSFFELRDKLSHSPPISKLFRKSKLLRKAYSNLPFAANMTKEEYIPTRLLSLLRTLRNHFPRHRLLLSDFSYLPDTVPGINAPVVQTRYQNEMVPCTTLLVKHGAFDIFFPTDFERLRDMYEWTLSQPLSLPRSAYDPSIPTRSTPFTQSSLSLSIASDFFSPRHSNRRSPVDGISSASGLPIGEHKSGVFTHAEFMNTFADLQRTRLRNGENPMLDFYKNVKFLF